MWMMAVFYFLGSFPYHHLSIKFNVKNKLYFFLEEERKVDFS